MSQEKQSITPEKAMKLLKEHGTIITVEQAKIILNFLYKFGKLTLHQAFKQ